MARRADGARRRSRARQHRYGCRPIAAGRAGPEPAGGGCRVVMRYANQVAAADIVLPDLWRVRGDERLIEDLRAQANVRAAFRYA
jgi:hypothetical protein